MKGWNAATFGDTMPDYDHQDWAVATDEAEATDFLAGFAKGGRALELGVGTGRVAIPLARRGVRTTGIEASAAMVGQLERKLGGGDEVRAVLGDFADVAAVARSQAPFDLVYCVHNTFLLLLTQEEQVRCFRGVAEVLAPGGVFVLQVSAPRAYLLSERQSVHTLDVGLDRTVLLAATHDPVSQRVDRQQVVMTEAGNRLYPLAYRYVFHAELDLMGALAGLPLSRRWGGWRGEPFTGAGFHVSVYHKPVG
ncbi:class I SAM-dependent methyltransferase [Streptomyces sp. CRN 30]|uniref:class I SAM-dependent methyltransferase n=1 Tax=Streptomyces sp. CRN 30 TaxID=3075613 RepID=UPI002A82D528|nr:class I SAM-dependent methyltransferase [Streptomyces sp. CRN 30]